MSSGLTHIGAIARGLAYAPAAPRAPAQAAVTAIRPAAPVENVAEAREQVRGQIMAERGVDPMSLYKLAPQDRIRAEVDMMLEGAVRDLKARSRERADIRATGTLLDLRV